MLTAIMNRLIVQAGKCSRKDNYLCPNPSCGSPVILKRGTRRIAHFAHKSKSTCVYAGESNAHLTAKSYICDEYQRRGYLAVVEVVVLSSMEDRRADVLVASPRNSNVRYAIEVQDSKIGEIELDRRTRAYDAERVRPVWISLLRPNAWKPVVGDGGQSVVRKFSPKLYERWIEKKAGEVWFFDVEKKVFWNAQFKAHLLWKDGADYFDTNIEDTIQTPGYEYPSKRWVDAIVSGPWPLSQIQISANGTKSIGTLTVRPSDS